MMHLFSVNFRMRPDGFCRHIQRISGRKWPLPQIPLRALEVFTSRCCAPDGDSHAIRLGTPVTRFFRKFDFCSDFETAEGATENAVSVKIEVPPVRRCQKTAVLIFEQLADFCLRVPFAMFHVTSLPPGIVLEASSGSPERVVDGLAQVFMRVSRLHPLLNPGFAESQGLGLERGLTADDEFTAWHRQVDANVVRAAFPTAERPLHRYPTAHNSFMKHVKFRGFLAYPLRGIGRRFQTPESDL